MGAKRVRPERNATLSAGVERPAAGAETGQHRRAPSLPPERQPRDSPREDRRQREREADEEPHREELAEEDLPAGDRPGEEERHRPLDELCRDDVGADDRDEERDEEDAPDAGEASRERRTG